MAHGTRLVLKSIFIFGLTLSIFLTGCEEDQTTKAASSGELLKSTQLKLDESWVHFDQNPVIAAGDMRKGAFWNDPCVLPDGNGGYIMYLTTSTVEPFKPPVLPFRATSENGRNWNLDENKPLLSEKGSPFVSLETPTVVFFKGRYHMYFTGIYKSGSTHPMAIGHAVSDDGIRWELEARGRPILEATGIAGDWNSYLVGEPGAVVFQNKVYLYFSAVGSRPGGNPPQLQVIGLATSDDGHSFRDARQVLGQSRKFPASQGFVGYSTPQPTLAEGEIHLFYDVARFVEDANPSWFQTALQKAVSGNGVDFREDEKPFAFRNMSGWNSLEVRSPSALFEDGGWTVWYAGHGDLQKLFESLGKSGRAPYFGIGIASQK